jgi:hypothetical protein
VNGAGERVFDQAHQLVRGAIDRQFAGCSLMSDHGGLSTLQAHFHDAPFVVRAVFVAVVIFQVHVYTRDVVAEPTESSFYFAADVGRQGLVALNVVIGIELNLHGVFRWRRGSPSNLHYATHRASPCLYANALHASQRGSAG